MNDKIDNWEDLRLFISVAQEGGLSPAARATGRSAATLGRRMLALERRMQKDLFVRHDRGYELTSHGRKLLGELKEIEAHIIRATSPGTEQVTRLVKVSAGTWTTLALIRRLNEIAGMPPDARLRFISVENILDIPRREVVIGIRNKRPVERGLAGRKLSRVEFAPYATTPNANRWIKVLADTPSGRWLEKSIGNDAVCEVNSPRNGLDLALAGDGIALLPTFIGDAESALNRVGSTIPELSHDRWIVFHQDDRHLPEVRRAIDRICNVLKNGTAP
ncbi:LysR family transcriptional regulator [Shimia sp.]|uniref:LysR family transcriptional regulator n=1 Tax=Shimia sp. TaxID=1954381 RepID=UPI003290A9BD